jgi:deoxyribose-phosphate aldolase
MNLAQYFDHTYLKPDVSDADVKRVVQEAIDHGCYGVCIPPFFVHQAVEQIGDNDGPKVVTVVGFPYGFASTPAKIEDIKRALDDGADEIDIVVNLGAIRAGNWNHVHNDIDRCSTAVRLRGKVSKIILETGLLNEQEIIRLCQICNESGVDFAKTSTGVNGPGADVDTIRLLRAHLDASIKIKASGGIRNRADALALIEAGADRIGSSSTVAILQDRPADPDASY